MSVHNDPGDGLPEYANAEEYDAQNTWGADDDFYLELAREVGGPVLDVGCGTGRLTRAIAASGLDVTGLDVTRAMLERARLLSDGVDVEWIHGDARTMMLGRKFRLILMTSHGFQHMLADDDIDAFFERMREHLADDGVLAFETRNFAAKTFGGSEEPKLWKSYQDPQGRWIDAYFSSRYDPETGIEYLFGKDIIRETGEVRHDSTALRYVTVEQLNAFLRRHGFELLHQYGDWQKGPLGPEQPEVVSICRLAG